MFPKNKTYAVKSVKGYQGNEGWNYVKIKLIACLLPFCITTTKTSRHFLGAEQQRKQTLVKTMYIELCYFQKKRRQKVVLFVYFKLNKVLKFKNHQ